MSNSSPRAWRLDNRPESQKTAVRAPVVTTWKFLTSFNATPPHAEPQPLPFAPQSSFRSSTRSGIVSPLDTTVLSSRPVTSSTVGDGEAHLVYNPTAASDAPDATPLVTDGEGVTPVLRFQNIINAAVESAEQRVANILPPTSAELLARFTVGGVITNQETDDPHRSVFATPSPVTVPMRRGLNSSQSAVRPPPATARLIETPSQGYRRTTRIVARVRPPESTEVAPSPETPVVKPPRAIKVKNPPKEEQQQIENSPVVTVTPSNSPGMSRSGSIVGIDSLNGTKMLSISEKHVHFGSKPMEKTVTITATDEHKATGPRRSKRNSALSLSRKASIASNATTSSVEWVAAGGVAKDDPVFKILSNAISDIKEDCGFVDPVEVAALDNVLLGLQHANMHRIYGQLHSLKDVSHEFASQPEAPIDGVSAKKMVNAEAFPLARRIAVESKPPRTIAAAPSTKRDKAIAKPRNGNEEKKSWTDVQSATQVFFEAKAAAERKVANHFSLMPGADETPPSSRPLTPVSAALQFVEHRPPKKLRKGGKAVVIDDAFIAARALENIVREPDMDEFEKQMVVTAGIIGGTQQIIDSVRHLRLVMPPEMHIHYDPER